MLHKGNFVFLDIKITLLITVINTGWYVMTDKSVEENRLPRQIHRHMFNLKQR